VANKVEQFIDNFNFAEFYSLGLGDPIPISAAHGMNTGDLLDTILKYLPPPNDYREEEEITKVAVIGKPNVGKSSLVNYLLGENRAIVTNIPGTTRDALDTRLTREGSNYVLIDTAGLRRQGKIRHSTERYSVFRTLRAVDRCHVALILLDALEGVTSQDKRIAAIPHEAGKGSILVINKWDLLRKEQKNIDQFNEVIRKELAFLSYAPIISISAVSGQRVGKLLKIVDRVAEQAKQRVETGLLNKYLEEVIALNPPPAYKGQSVKFFYGSQTGIQPPTFVFFVNRSDLIHFSYKRYLENKIREAFGFEGNPLRLLFRDRS
jgi:GTP-binding protein